MTYQLNVRTKHPSPFWRTVSACLVGLVSLVMTRPDIIVGGIRNLHG